MRRTALALATAAALCAAPAQAAITTTNWTISGTGSGTFTLDFDSNTSLYTLTALNFTLAGTTYNTANSGLSNQSPTLLILGANAGGGVLVVAGATNDFWLFFDPTLLLQSVSGDNASYSTGAGTILSADYRLSQVPGTAVPEPATWAMMLLGLGGIGFAARRARKVQPVG